MRSGAARRARKSARRASDFSDLKEVLKDGRVFVELATVQAHGTGQHWSREDEDLLVEVVTCPRGRELVCRLGAAAGQASSGLWRVPAVGTEVVVAIPDGEPDHHPTIVACLSSGAAPARAGADKTLLAAPDAIELDAPAIRAGGDAATHPTIMADLRQTAESTMLTALATALTEAAAGLTGAGQGGHAGAVTAGATAVTAFKNLLGNHNTTVLKVR